MKRTFGWGVLGAGSIAAKFATDLKNLPEARLAAVGSRSIDKAAAFANRHGFERSHGSYEELVSDPGVDVVYIATPHPFHKGHALLCLDHGKAVLCEKPMGVGAAQVREMVDCARDRNLFLMEAMWTRFLPAIRQVKQWLQEGCIGDVRMLWADFGFRAGWNPEGRLLDPDLAGGSLLDVGVYTVALSFLVFGGPPAEIQAAAHIGETGVDEQTAVLFRYEDGGLASLFSAVRTNSPQGARICGTEGSIEIPSFWKADGAELHVHGQEPVRISEPSGYHFEAAEVMACLSAGRTESPAMPLDESVSIARVMDRVRSIIGLTYPFERSAA
jgi:predicted dehydrogenase